VLTKHTVTHSKHLTSFNKALHVNIAQKVMKANLLAAFSST
jgi:hypothetical protein